MWLKNICRNVNNVYHYQAYIGEASKAGRSWLELLYVPSFQKEKQTASVIGSLSIGFVGATGEFCDTSLDLGFFTPCKKKRTSRATCKEVVDYMIC